MARIGYIKNVESDNQCLFFDVFIAESGLCSKELNAGIRLEL
jgi:hypothetical protein